MAFPGTSLWQDEACRQVQVAMAIESGQNGLNRIVGIGDSSAVEHQICNRKVSGSSLAGAVGKFSSPWSIFCADSYFGIAIACKISRSFCQKCSWQVTAKHACTLYLWLCMK